MKIETIGDFLAIKDNQNEVKHLVPKNRIFVHKHPIDNGCILFSDRSKKSVKDAIRIRVSDLTKIGLYVVDKPSRAIALIYISILLDPTKSILNTYSTLDGYLLMNGNSDEFPLEYDDISNEPIHVFNSYDLSPAVLLIEGAASKSFTYRITNGALFNATLRNDANGAVFSYLGVVNTEYLIAVGKTIEVDFDINTGIHTITNL